MLASFLELGGTQTPAPGALYNVSELGGTSTDAVDQSEMLIVANPTNPLNLVGFSHRLTGPITLDVYRSTDGGLNWTITQIDNTDDGQGSLGNRFDPAIAFDANGLLYIAYGYRGQAVAPTRPTDLIVATSSDGGLTFGNFQQIDSQADIVTPNPSDNDMPGLDRWTLATGRDDNSGNQACVIAYTRNVTETVGMTTGTDQQITVRGSRDGWTTWTAPVIINDGSISGTDAGNLAAAPVFGAGIGNGLYVTWWDGVNAIQMDRDTDGLWGNASTFNFAPDITVRTNAGLVNVGPPGPPAQPERGLKMSPVLASNISASHLYVAFQEVFSGNDTDIWFGRSTNLGLNWDFVKVEGSSGTDFHPQIAVDEHSNAIAIAYYTTDGDQGGGNDDVRMRIAVSTDFGNTWTKTNVNALTSNEAGGTTNDYLEYTGLSFRDGTAQVLWASRGGSGGDLEAFTAPVSLNSSTNGNTLAIFSLGGASDSIVVQQSPLNPNYVEVLFNGVREYAGFGASIDSVRIEARGGTDSLSLINLPAIPVSVYGTNNADTLNINAFSGASGMTIFAGDGADTININPMNLFGVAAVSSSIVIQGGGGLDAVNLGNSINGVQSILGNIHVENDPSFTLININDGPNSSARNFAIDQWDGNIGAIGGLAPGYITWDRSDVQTVNITTGTGADEISLLRTSEAINFYQDNLFNARDNLIIGNDVNGMQSITAAINVGPNGGLDFTDITLKDTADTVGRTAVWTKSAGGYTISGLAPGAITYDYQSVVYVGVLGGSGNDNYVFMGIDDDWAQTVIDGGGGFNTLQVDDVAMLYSPDVAVIKPDSIHRGIGNAVGVLDIFFSNIHSPTYYAKNTTTSIEVQGVSSTIPSTHQLTVISGAGNDMLRIYPHDQFGNLTINGNFGYGGGNGADTVIVDDTAFPFALPINYSFYNQFGPGTTNIGGVGAAGFGAANDVENIYVYGGGADDTFSISSFQSGSGLGIYAGGGNDTLNFGVSNLTSEITNMAFFNFDGQGGSDTYNINNTGHPNAFTYTRSSGSISMNNGLGASYFLTDASVDLFQINAGDQADSFYVDAVAAGSQMIINAGGGSDGLAMGYEADSVENIRGAVTFNGQSGGGHLAVSDTTDATGDTFHLDQTSLGAYVGDNLFGPGGALYFNSLVNYVDGIGLRTFLGSGADTIYAQPLPTARVSIQANNPAAAPGDKLTLALSQAINPVVNGTSSGTVTSVNLQPLDWTGIETLMAPDTIAPTVDIVDVMPDPRTTFVTSIAINFSEAVSGFSLADLVLTRNGGAVLLPGTATLTSANQINWTLGNLSGLTNVSGNYVLSLAAAGSGVSDLAGNPLTLGATDSWTANIPPLMGDANGDNVVDIFDVNLVSMHWGESGPLGDVNNDGMVDIFDVNLISEHWGMMAGGGGGSSAVAGETSTGAQPSGSIGGGALRIAGADANDHAGGAPGIDATSVGNFAAGLRIHAHSLRRLAAIDALFGDGGAGDWSDDALGGRIGTTRGRRRPV